MTVVTPNNLQEQQHPAALGAIQSSITADKLYHKQSPRQAAEIQYVMSCDDASYSNIKSAQLESFHHVRDDDTVETASCTSSSTRSVDSYEPRPRPGVDTSDKGCQPPYRRPMRKHTSRNHSRQNFERSHIQQHQHRRQQHQQRSQRSHQHQRQQHRQRSQRSQQSRPRPQQAQHQSQRPRPQRRVQQQQQQEAQRSSPVITKRSLSQRALRALIRPVGAAAGAMSNVFGMMAQRSHSSFEARKKVDREIDLGIFFYD